jgi:hypothetical protein
LFAGEQLPAIIDAFDGKLIGFKTNHRHGIGSTTAGGSGAGGVCGAAAFAASQGEYHAQSRREASDTRMPRTPFRDRDVLSHYQIGKA